MVDKRKSIYALLVLISLIALFFVYSPIAQAQNWMALPPYNTLWPLWSPALSPVDSITGLPTPIVTSLTPATVLPVQPGLTWNPASPNPWLLYNTPLGMAYYDPFVGINLWPPKGLLTSTGQARVLKLPVGYATLPATNSSWITTNVPLGNSALTAYLKTITATGPSTVPPVFIPISAII
jgi:hypothetical protein